MTPSNITYISLNHTNHALALAAYARTCHVRLKITNKSNFKKKNDILVKSRGALFKFIHKVLYFYKKKEEQFLESEARGGGGGCMALDLNPNIFINIKIEIFH